MMSRHRFVSVALTLLMAASVSGCGDTWRGLKKDTGENIEKTGEALDRVGEKVQGEEAQD